MKIWSTAPLATVIVATLTGCSSSSSDVREGQGYVLTNSFLGSNSALVAGARTDQPPTLLGFTTASDDPRIEWIITSLDSGYYRISNQALGAEFSLDIINEGNRDELRMAETDSVTGQRWLVTLLDNGSCRLTSDFLGPDTALDATVDTDVPARPVMRTSGNFTGQFWQLTPVGSGPDPVLARCDGDPE